MAKQDKTKDCSSWIIYHEGNGFFIQKKIARKEHWRDTMQRSLPHFAAKKDNTIMSME